CPVGGQQFAAAQVGGRELLVGDAECQGGDPDGVVGVAVGGLAGVELLDCLAAGGGYVRPGQVAEAGGIGVQWAASEREGAVEIEDDGATLHDRSVRYGHCVQTISIV